MSPAHAVSDRDVVCSGGGYFKVRNNKVVQKIGGESTYANRCRGTAVIPDGVTEIGDYGFNTEDLMSNIMIPDSVTKIGGAGLADTHLTSINLPAGLTFLSQGALGYNGYLTTLVIPANVATIETFALFGAHGLCNIYFLGTVAPNSANGAFNGICESSPWAPGAPTGDGAPKAWPPQGATGYGPLGSSYRGLTVSSGAAVILYDANGADSGSVPATQVLSPGATVQLPADAGSLVRANATFDGWNTAKNGEGQSYPAGGSFIASEGTTIIYANWLGDPKVKYNGNGNTGGSVPVDQDSPHAKNSSVTVLGNSGSLTNTGYTFDGWNTQADGSGTSYQPSNVFTIATTSVTLYAKWKPETHTVTYMGNDNTSGSVPGVATYNYNSTVTVAGNTGELARTGYTFGGWNTAADGSGTDRAAASTFAVTSADAVLYAKWTPRQFGVSYDGNGNTSGAAPGGPLPHSFNSNVTVLGNTGNMAKTGYTFSGWNTAADGSGTNRGVGSTFTLGAENVTLYAKWVVQSFTVTYDGNGSDSGTVPTPWNSPVIYGSVFYTSPHGDLAKEGFVFASWNTAADGSGTRYGYPNQFTMPASNVVLYAQWVLPYTVTYDGNGNTGGNVPVETLSPYEPGTQYRCQANDGELVKTGYKFVKWNSAADGSGTDCLPIEIATANSNTTWYAQYLPAYTISYNGNGNTGGTAPIDSGNSHVAGEMVTIENEGNLVREGYVFDGWNTEPDATGAFVSYGFASYEMAPGNVNLYAVWIPLKTVTYIGNGNTSGTVPVDAGYYMGEDSVHVSGNTGQLARTGYTFAGWNSAANGKGTHFAATGLVTTMMGESSIVFYAEWKEIAVPNQSSAKVKIRFPTGMQSLTSANRAAIKAAVAKSGRNARFAVVCRIGASSLVRSVTSSQSAHTCEKSVRNFFRSLGVKDSQVIVTFEISSTSTRITIRFAYGSSVLTNVNKNALKRGVLKSGTSAKFVIVGGVGDLMAISSADEIQLAKNRGKSIRTYLKKLGVKSSNVVIKLRVFHVGVTPKTRILAKVL